MSGAIVVHPRWIEGAKGNGPHVVLGFIGHCGEASEPAARAAAQVFAAAGGYVEAVLVPDLCVFPYLGIGMMRNYIAIHAWEAGADFMMLLDDDAIMPPDAIMELVGHKLNAVVPLFACPGFRPDIRISYPQIRDVHGQHGLDMFTGEDGVVDPAPYSPNGRLALLRWSVVSCALFSRRGLELCDADPFPNSMARAEDEYTWARLRRKGLQLYQDTAVRVTLVRPPGLIDKLFDLWVQHRGLTIGLERGLEAIRQTVGGH